MSTWGVVTEFGQMENSQGQIQFTITLMMYSVIVVRSFRFCQILKHHGNEGYGHQMLIFTGE